MKIRLRFILVLGGIGGILTIVGIVNYIVNQKGGIHEYKDDFNTCLYYEMDKDSRDACLVTFLEEREYGGYPRNYLSEKCMWGYDAKYIEGDYVDIGYLLKAKINFYDPKTLKKIDSIDIKHALKKYIPNVRWQGSVFGVNTEDDKLFFRVGGFEDNSQEITFIDIEYPSKEVTVVEMDDYHEEYSIAANAKDARYEQRQAMYNVFKYDEFGLLEKNGFTKTTSVAQKGAIMYGEAGGGQVMMQITGDTLPLNNTKLYDQFPGLKEYQGNNEVMVTIYFEEEPSAEDILSLLMEDGQEISYEGCVLPAELSIDGQSHDIHSFEEYVQWRKQEE